MKLIQYISSIIFFYIITILYSCDTLQQAPSRPNVLVIVTDDQGYADVSAFAHAAPDISTPNMDRIAHSGILFTQAYVSAPVCSPSRAGWNTGRRQQRWDPTAGWSPGLPQQETGIAEYFKQSGYATAKFGKSDYGGKEFEGHTDRDYPLNHGFDEFLGFCAHSHDYFYIPQPKENQPSVRTSQTGPLYYNTGYKGFDNAYTTEIFTDAAIDFMQRHKDQPFFMTLSYNSVHDLIHEAPERYLQKVGVTPIPVYDPTTMGSYSDYYNLYCDMGPATDEDMRKYYRANLMCLDDNIGRVLDFMEEMKISDNTLIVFMSDNGGAPNTGSNNRPLRNSKYTLFEGGIRVPFMMRWPARLPQGQLYEYPVSSLDIVPTCLEAAGMPMPEPDKFDGASLLEAVTNGTPSRTATHPMYWQFGKHWAVRDGDWKLVLTFIQLRWQSTSQVLSGPLAEGRPMLFNLKDDISEQQDLYDQHPDIVQRLSSMQKQWQEEIGIAEQFRIKE